MERRSLIVTRLEKAILGREDLDVTERRRRIFLALAASVAIPIIVVLNLAGVFVLDNTEIIIDALTLVVLVANIVLIRWLRTGTWFYRLDALFIGAVLLAYLVQDAGTGTSMLWCFTYPLVFMFLLGKREGSIWTVVFLLGGAIALLTGQAELSTEFQGRFLASFLMCSTLAYSIESLRERFEGESRAAIEELEKALSEVKTLKGLLPICANCKKVRDDEGYWSQIESYLGKHADASFTHSVCPECIEKLYPEFVDEYMKTSKRRHPERSKHE